jgi:HPt (histidine-containing phosphotransfer) domain-containing protein
MPDTFDATELLDSVSNDFEFLCDAVQMLAADSPDMIDELRRSAAAGDAAAAARVAHTLKGMISNFCSPPTYAAALAAEQLTRAGDLSAALTSAVQTLEAKLAALVAELNGFIAERARCGS